MLIFVDTIYKALNITLWRCDKCGAQFEVHIWVGDVEEDPSYCPNCGGDHEAKV